MRARLHVVAALGALVALGAIAFAQAPAAPQVPPKGIIEKGRAPVSDKLLQVKLPRPQEADLSNGMHVMVLEDRRASQVSVQMMVRGAGGYFDPADHIGLAQFTAANMREGTATKSSTEIAERLERLAASLTVGTGMSSEDATVSASALTENLDAVLDLMTDVILNPAFPEQELNRYKTQLRAQLIQQRANPSFLVQERFSLVMAPGHPDSRTSPSAEALDKTTRASLVAFHKARYVPDHGVIAIAGDISMTEAMKKLEARFGSWKKAGAPVPQVSDPASLKGPGIYLVERPNSVQTNLIVGVQAIRRTDPDWYAWAVLNKVIGGGPTGRLFRHLREDKGYTYGAYSALQGSRFRGVWEADTDVRTEVTEPALTDLLDELKQVRETPIPAKEFTEARRSLIAAFALQLESPNALLQNAITVWRFNLARDYWDRYPERIMAITQADAQAIAKKYLDPSRVQSVAVGNGEAIARALRKLGPVEVYDAEGKKIATY